MLRWTQNQARINVKDPLFIYECFCFVFSKTFNQSSHASSVKISKRCEHNSDCCSPWCLGSRKNLSRHCVYSALVAVVSSSMSCLWYLEWGTSSFKSSQFPTYETKRVEFVFSSVKSNVKISDLKTRILDCRLHCASVRLPSSLICRQALKCFLADWRLWRLFVCVLLCQFDYKAVCGAPLSTPQHSPLSPPLTHPPFSASFSLCTDMSVCNLDSWLHQPLPSTPTAVRRRPPSQPHHPPPKPLSLPCLFLFPKTIWRLHYKFWDSLT